MCQTCEWEFQLHLTRENYNQFQTSLTLSSKKWPNCALLLLFNHKFTEDIIIIMCVAHGKS